MPNWLPISISVLSLAISAIFGLLAFRDRRQTSRISREREIFAWAVTTLELFPDLKADDENLKSKALLKLSVQIDVGRLLFPNDKRTEFGKDKHPLNHGFRSKVLDPLADLYLLVGKPGTIDVQRFERFQKDFIYEVSLHFPPVKTNTSPEFLVHWQREKRNNS